MKDAETLGYLLSEFCTLASFSIGSEDLISELVTQSYVFI